YRHKTDNFRRNGGVKVMQNTRPPRNPGATRRSPIGVDSDQSDVLGLRALLALHDFELHPLVLVQRAEAVHRDGGVVNEDVCVTAVLSDEAEALLAVEPLDGSLCHGAQVLLRT